MLRSKPGLRRSILLGTPIATGILLLLHPLPESAEMGISELPKGLELYELLVPIADDFLAVHMVFPLVLALLAVSVFLLLDGIRGIAAAISRFSAFIFAITYIMYETIIGTVTGLLVRNAASLTSAEKVVIGDAIHRNYTDPILGDLPSGLSVIAWLSWVLAVVLAAVALHRAGKPLGSCILLGLSFIFVSHASMLGPLGMLLYLFAVIWIERAGSSVIVVSENETAPFLK